MSLRGKFALAILATFYIFSPSVVEAAGRGENCRRDSDCDGKLDCQRIRAFKKICLPISCAKGAGQAVLDSGFSPDTYLDSLKSKTGLNARSFASLSDEDDAVLTKAINEDKPPIEVFTANYTACINPTRNEDGELLAPKAPTSETWYGLQWSIAALFSYFGKTTWKEYTTGPPGFEDDRRTQFSSNCIGALVGGDVGLDVLFQIWDFDDGEQDMSPLGEDTGSFENTQYVPVFIVGPIGLQVGWFEDGGPNDGPTIIEVTLGPSLGAALGGFSQCYNEIEDQNI